MRAVATFIGLRRRREATPMRRLLIAVAGLAVGVGFALAQAATTHAYPSDPAVGKLARPLDCAGFISHHRCFSCLLGYSRVSPCSLT